MGIEKKRMTEEKMTVDDAQKLISVVDSCCKTFLFTKREVVQIATICLQAIDRVEKEMQGEEKLSKAE